MGQGLKIVTRVRVLLIKKKIINAIPCFFSTCTFFFWVMLNEIATKRIHKELCKPFFYLCLHWGCTKASL